MWSHPSRMNPLEDSKTLLAIRLSSNAQPVHDELEYIKMRYKSPARVGYRDNCTYETLESRSNYSTVDQQRTHTGVDGPNLNNSDDSFERLADKRHRHLKSEVSQVSTSPNRPWGNIRSLPQQTSLGYTDPAEQPNSYNIIGETQGVTIV